MNAWLPGWLVLAAVWVLFGYCVLRALARPRPRYCTRCGRPHQLQADSVCLTCKVRR